MRRVAALFVWILCSSCGREEPPTAVAPRPPAPAPPPAPPPAVQEPAPAPSPPPAVQEPGKAPPPPPPPPKAVPAPEPGPDVPKPTTPLFTFRSLGDRADILINGRPAGTTPLAWALSDATRFDPKIPVKAWPPPHAMLASQTSTYVDDGWVSTELWITGGKHALDDREAFRRLYPHVAEDEHVVFVRTVSSHYALQGAFRLRVEEHRFVLHRPADVSEESPDFHRWNRTLWFERE